MHTRTNSTLQRHNVYIFIHLTKIKLMFDSLVVDVIPFPLEIIDIQMKTVFVICRINYTVKDI